MRRRGRSEDPEDFLPCEFCCGFFRSSLLWKHARSCTLRPTVSGDDTSSNAVANGKLLLEAASPITTSTTDVAFQRAVLHNMRGDELARVVKKDSFIVKFGSVLFRKLGRHRAHDISQRMRQLGRLKVKLHEVSQVVKPLARYITGMHFDDVISSVEDLCGLAVDDSGRRCFRNPSLALKLGHSLVKCAQIKKGLAIREDNIQRRQDAEAYLSLHHAEYCDAISSSAMATLQQRKHNKPLELPVTDDLVKLKQYQTQQIAELTSQLQRSPCHSTWRQLSDIVLSRLITFNKRRGGEAARLLLKTYTDRPQWDASANGELMNSLKPLEKELIKRLVVIFYALWSFIDSLPGNIHSLKVCLR